MRLARLQQLISLSIGGCTAAWIISAPNWRWAVGGPAVVLATYAVVMAVEFGLSYISQRAAANLGWPSPAQLAVAWLGEVTTAPRVFLWRQPFAAGWFNDRPESTPPRAVGVVLVHGFFCNRGLWNPWTRRLRDLGIPFVAVNLEPIFGSIADYPSIIEGAIAELTEATKRGVVLVGHSMGGLAIRAWLVGPTSKENIRRVVTIATPHSGTWLARFAWTTNGRQMRPNSPWLRDLASRERPAPFERFTCFYGNCDNIVFPASAATLPGAENIPLEGVAHVHMAFHAAVFDRVVRECNDAETGETTF